MKSLKLIVDLKSLSFNESNKNFYGNVFLDINGKYYPDKNWNDFVLRLLLTWAYNLINYNKGTLYFFDGPYEIQFQKNGHMLDLCIESLGVYNCETKVFLQIIRDALMEIYNMEKYSQMLDERKIMSCVQMIDNNIV